MASLVGTTLSHYEVERLLGAGGMGEVYLATDRALGRKAALKVLSPDADSELRARALREARAIAQLQHPGIVTFFESGEVSPSTFIAMEYIEGRTLRARLAEGPMAVGEAVSLIDAVLDALGHAHGAGILHRDIKPENIMLTDDGSVKLLDFGLAKPALRFVSGEAATEAALTEQHQMLGTIGYMPPEQLRAQELGPQADLFSVGVVLYECLAGRHPFEAQTPAAQIAALLTESPRPLEDPDIPERLRRIVLRALTKEAESRYATCAELLRDLRALELHGPGEHFPDSLAVMSFRDVSEAPTDAWIGVAIAESLATDVARAAELMVLPRDEAEAALRSTPDEVDAARSLGCRWVLFGETSRADDRLSIRASLVEVATADPLASREAEGTLGDLFQIQRGLAEWVLGQLNQAAPTLPMESHDLAAHELFAKGIAEVYTLEKGALQRASGRFARVVEDDPSHGRALAGLAASTAMRFSHTTDPADLETAAGYARRALDTDAQLPDALTWMGYVLFRQSKLDEAARYLADSMALVPNAPMPPYFAGCVALGRRRIEEAKRFYRRAIELQEGKRGVVHSGAGAWVGLGWSHLELGRFDDAISSFERATEFLDSRSGASLPGSQGYLAECHRRAGDAALARASAMAGLGAVEERDHIYRDTLRGVCLVALGRAALAQSDRDGASAAFRQARQHLRGRDRALGGGHLLVQAGAGLARASGDLAAWQEARALFEGEGFDFTWYWMCSDDVTLFELARGAEALELAGEAEAFRARALAAGSIEAQG